jgi:hypothetical protein
MTLKLFCLIKVRPSYSHHPDAQSNLHLPKHVHATLPPAADITASPSHS